MALEDSITELTAEAGKLLDLPQQIADTTADKITALNNAYVNVISKGLSVAYVNGNSGSDDNEGSQASPFRTIAHAVNQCPRGGRVIVYLMSSILLDEDVDCLQREVYIWSADGARHAISFKTGSYVVGNETRRRLDAAFNVISGGLSIKGIDLALPTGTGNPHLPNPLASPINCGPPGSRPSLMPRINLQGVDINVAGTPFGPLIATGSFVQAIALDATLVSWSGDRTDGNGITIYGVNDAAGTDTATLPWLVTNLNTI